MIPNREEQRHDINRSGSLSDIHSEQKRRVRRKQPLAQRIPRLRWGIGVLLGVGVLINYFDRINLSVAAPQLKHEFGLTDGELGWLFSGFFWSYALLQIPTGMILDRFGVTTRQSRQHVFLVALFHRDCFCRRIRRYLWRAHPAGCRRGARLSGKL